MTADELERVDIGILREQTSNNIKQIERLNSTITGVETRLTGAVQSVESKVDASLRAIQAEIKGIATPNLNNVWRIITFAVSVIGLIGTFLFGIAQWQIAQLRGEFDNKIQSLDRICVERNTIHEKHLDKIDELLSRDNERKLRKLDVYDLHEKKATP